MTAAFVASFATTSVVRGSATGRSLSSAAFALPPNLMASSASSSGVEALGHSLQLASATTTAATTTVFEPVAPDATALAAFASIVVLSAVAAWVWANQVVPVSRTKLALSKKQGPVRDYLEELRESAGNESNSDDAALAAVAAAASSNSTTITDLSSTTADVDNDGNKSSNNKDDRAFERWLFTDWLEKSPSTGGRQKPSALPVLKDAKWNSGDNPVLAATALILLGVVFTAVTERIFFLSSF